MGKNFNKLRNYDEHEKTLEAARSLGINPIGDCKFCADAWCLFNITSKDVWDKFGGVLDPNRKGYNDIPDVRQYTCESSVEDPAILNDLRD